MNYCEVDKYASKAYSLIHNEPESKNLGDITKVDEKSLLDFDLLTYGFPCQNISVAGKLQGFAEGTRSRLLFEALRIIKYKKPKICICENVKNLTSKKFRPKFDKLILELESYGYKNYWKIMNAKDFGVPQNRERVFIVSVRNDIPFEFPEPTQLTKSIKDILEPEVDEKYYLSQMWLDRFVPKNEGSNIVGRVPNGNGTNAQREIMYSAKSNIGAILATDYKFPKIIQVLKLFDTNSFSNPQRGRVYSIEGVSPTLNTCQGGGSEVKIIASRGRYNAKGEIQQQLEINNSGCSNTITSVQKDNYVIKDNCRIRKLTPLEYFRLMGFYDSDYQVLHDNGISNSQIYKMAGNSIVVPVLEGIFRNLKEQM